MNVNQTSESCLSRTPRGGLHSSSLSGHPCVLRAHLLPESASPHRFSLCRHVSNPRVIWVSALCASVCAHRQKEAFPSYLLWMHCFSFHIAVGSCVGCSTRSFSTLPSDWWYADFSASTGRKISKIYLDAETEGWFQASASNSVPAQEQMFWAQLAIPLCLCFQLHARTFPTILSWTQKNPQSAPRWIVE